LAALTRIVEIFELQIVLWVADDKACGGNILMGAGGCEQDTEVEPRRPGAAHVYATA
jgi:hypothetical protein